jgi:hypothetical protein
VIACTTCHTSPPALNPFGRDVARNRAEGAFETVLSAALAEVEPLDSDGDGLSNLMEIAAGTFPGNGLSMFRIKTGTKERKYDPWFAYRRMSVAFCGTSPTYKDMQDLTAATDRTAFLHAKLDACLAGNYWNFEALARIADEKIRPVALMGHCLFGFTDFEKDYHLFGFTMTGGRDVREMLTAKYHVKRDGDRYAVIDESSGPAGGPQTRAGVACQGATPPGAPPGVRLSPRQATPPGFRAGMWTTQHSLAMNTVTALMPRVTAAAAYRNYLGYELSQYEGIHAVLNEPRDVDKKNVAQRTCANCHTTLDPLAYAFAYYWGAAGPPRSLGEYDPTRPQTLFDVEADVVAEWVRNEPRPAIFGRQVSLNSEANATGTSSLVQMATAASESNPFAFNVVRMVFKHATGGQPEATDWREMAMLTEELKRRRYSVDAMIHRMIETLAFGGVQ